MGELFHTRDVVVYFMGDRYTTQVSPAMMATGWAGGQGVQWTDAPTDAFQVTYSDGLYGGFCLWGSDEPSDQYISYVGQQVAYGYTTFCAGGWLIATKTFERYTWASRQAGPLVPITYTVGQRLVFSMRGYFTNEDEWTLSNDPRKPNEWYVANVVAVPTPNARGEYYITLQTSI